MRRRASRFNRWDHPLLARLNYPLVVGKDYTFLSGISTRDLGRLPPTAKDYPTPVQGLSVYTVSLPVVCAALVRILSSESLVFECRIRVQSDLMSLLSYNFFDMSKEREIDYEVDANTMTPADAEDLKTAVSAIKSWPYPAQDQWIKDVLGEMLTGETSSNKLPAERIGRL
ncbi:hypothetical protein B0T25DRAFT_574662 [Lasiosphaeria hispida]|uniref:Uncharacterized protein n=1 Tax=Lasiosphaeria hispida TaxID=260671 RepID=A0AAJ0H554_9PEZI|nr:hypothetical protein B0T25DRAFT_574662 [Lasiosphaeria hispida]